MNLTEQINKYKKKVLNSSVFLENLFLKSHVVNTLLVLTFSGHTPASVYRYPQLLFIMDHELVISCLLSLSQIQQRCSFGIYMSVMGCLLKASVILSA